MFTTLDIYNAYPGFVKIYRGFQTTAKATMRIFFNRPSLVEKTLRIPIESTPAIPIRDVNYRKCKFYSPPQIGKTAKVQTTTRALFRYRSLQPIGK